MRLTAYREAHVAALGGVLPERFEALCCVNDCLAWNATADEAGTAGLVGLYNYRLQT
jgi:hypothetical protein